MEKEDSLNSLTCKDDFEQPPWRSSHQLGEYFYGSGWAIDGGLRCDHCRKGGHLRADLKVLDQHFYDSRVQLPADFDACFGLSRKSGQSLMEFVTLHNEHLKCLSKHGVDLPNSVQGWHLLQRCNFTKEQKQLITLRAPQLEISKVTEALYLVLSQDYKHTTQAGFQDQRGFGKGGRSRGYEILVCPCRMSTPTIGLCSLRGCSTPLLRSEAGDFLPVIALNDSAAGNLGPGVTLPARSPSSKGKKGKSPKGKSGTYRYTPKPR